jgi:hypothetical protein
MKRGSTHFLRAVIFFIGLVVMVLCIFVLPIGIRAELKGDFDYGPILLGLYIPAIPFFIALYQSLKLLGFIDHNKTFSDLSVKALQIIKYCAFIICALFAAGMPYIFYIADRDDAPGVAAIGFVIVGASLVIGVFSAVLEKLLQNAIDIKTENDLMV